MKPKISIKFPTIIIGILGVIFCLVIAILLTICLPGHVYTYYLKPTSYSYGIPIRLQISKIGVDAVIIPLGIDKDGFMQAPVGAKDVGWYKFGPHPGEIGSAVIDGHYGYWKNGEESVFDNLNKLRKGDELYVEDEKGMVFTFVIREILIYDQNKDASNVFNSNDGLSHLNIITCEGIWDAVTKTYSERLVIFTDRK